MASVQTQAADLTESGMFPATDTTIDKSSEDKSVVLLSQHGSEGCSTASMGTSTGKRVQFTSSDGGDATTESEEQDVWYAFLLCHLVLTSPEEVPRTPIWFGGSDRGFHPPSTGNVMGRQRAPRSLLATG